MRKHYLPLAQPESQKVQRQQEVLLRWRLSSTLSVFSVDTGWTLNISHSTTITTTTILLLCFVDLTRLVIAYTLGYYGIFSEGYRAL